MLGAGDLFVLAAALLVTYVFIKWWKLSNFFVEKGIPYVKPIWPLGSDPKGLFLKENAAHSLTRMYNQFEKARIFGMYQAVNPILVVRDPEYIQNIYTTDFSHFVDRMPMSNEQNSPLEGHLFLLRGAKWRFLRAKLSPIFTSGKLKWMFSEMRKCVDTFTDYLKGSLPFGNDHDIKEDTVGFTTEVISSCAFGIDAKSIGDPNSDFRQFTRKAFKVDWKMIIKNIIVMVLPTIARISKVKVIDQEVEDWVLNLVKQSFDHRLKTGQSRNDFIQLLLQLREKGSVEFDDNDEDSDSEPEKSDHSVEHREHRKDVLELNDGCLGAQLFVFLAAGFETTSSTIYHLIYLFSLNQECQKKAREEVRKVLDKHNDYTYEMVKDLIYLGHCVDETLRLYPPVPLNFRTCTKDYTFPDGTTISKGKQVFLPTYAVQHDAKYFPEPEKFMPERFDGEIMKGTFSPFGDGPRICIGKRFALIEIMLAMARLLTEFQINPGLEKKDKIIFNPRSFLLSIQDGVKVQMEKIES